MKTNTEHVLKIAFFVAISVTAISILSLGVVFAQNTSGNGTVTPGPINANQPFYQVVIGVIATLATASATISGVIAYFIKALKKDNTKLGKFIVDGNEHLQIAAQKIQNTKEAQLQLGKVLFANMDGKLGSSAEIEQKLYSPKIKLIALEQEAQDAQKFVVETSDKGKILLTELGVIKE